MKFAIVTSVAVLLSASYALAGAGAPVRKDRRPLHRPGVLVHP